MGYNPENLEKAAGEKNPKRDVSAETAKRLGKAAVKGSTKK